MMDLNENIGLTKTDCQQILKNMLKGKPTIDFETISFEIKSLSDEPQGMLGEHFIVTIKYTTAKNEQHSVKCFLKNLNNKNEMLTHLTESLNAYDKEAYFYHTLLNECSEMGIDISFAPNGYYARPNFLVMEDIAQAGFRTGHKLIPLDLGQCRSALDTLAKYHMSVVIYESERRKIDTSYSLANERADIVLEKVNKDGTINVMERWINSSMEALLATIDLLPEDDDAVVTNAVFKEKLKWYLQRMHDDLKAKEGDLCCLLHNDLWINNIMFRYPSDADPNNSIAKSDPIDCKLVDYQTLSYGCPAVDVLRTIHSNTRQEFRDKHTDELLRRYFDKTLEVLKCYGFEMERLSNWTWETFSASYARAMVVVKLRAIAARSMTFMPDSVTVPLHALPDGMTRFVFTGRIETMTLGFKTDEFYRTIMSEDLYDLRNMLMKRVPEDVC